MTKETRQGLKQTLLLLFLGASILLIAVTWAEGLQEKNVPSPASAQNRAPTAVYEDATPEPSGTRHHEPGYGRQTRSPDVPVATSTRDVSGEEM